MPCVDLVRGPTPIPMAFAEASVLVQVGLLDPDTLPVTGVESAKKMLDANSLPSDLLIERARRDKPRQAALERARSPEPWKRHPRVFGVRTLRLASL